MSIKNIIKKFILGYKHSSDSYIAYLKKIGVSIGDGVKIFTPNQTNIDTQQPHLLRIGNNVNMTGPVTILVHDYSTIACKEVCGGGYCRFRQCPCC